MIQIEIDFFPKSKRDIKAIQKYAEHNGYESQQGFYYDSKRVRVKFELGEWHDEKWLGNFVKTIVKIIRESFGLGLKNFPINVSLQCYESIYLNRKKGG